jgi:hypothetical protein
MLESHGLYIVSAEDGDVVATGDADSDAVEAVVAPGLADAAVCSADRAKEQTE